MAWLIFKRKDLTSKSSSVAITGSLPTNSGIKPNFNKSSGSTSLKISPMLLSSFSLTSAPKPNAEPFPLLLITLSKPAKAPPHINKILVVST